MQNERTRTTSSSEQPDRQTDHLVLLVLVFLAGLLLGATVYALGMGVHNVRWNTFRNGAMVFLICIAGLSIGGIVLSLLFRFLALISPTTVNTWSQRSELKRRRRAAVKAIDLRHRVQEEQARLTAMMQASYLYERESARTANVRALAEFRKALQTGVINSCEVVFEHLNRTVEHYELVVQEIEASVLDDSEKAELLAVLSQQLDVGSMTQRHRSAQKMMEDAIWRVRFRKARLLLQRSPQLAAKYLQSIRKPDAGQRYLIQIDAMLREIQHD